MPIYAYKCSHCGFAKDVLQKMSDPQLTVCPSCGEAAFKKQLTAAGFQLKGSGWYVTDFKGGNKAAAPAAEKKDGAASGTGDGAEAKAASGASDKPAQGKAESAKPSAPAPAAASTPAASPPPPASDKK